MDNKAVINEIIRSFSGSQRVITFPEVYAKITGDVNTALFLNQLVFWSDKSGRKDGYFFKSAVEWEKEIFLTKHQVGRCTSKLENLGVLTTKIMKAGGAPTKHYKIDMDRIQSLIIEQIKTENTPETAPEMESKETGNGKLKNRKWIVKKPEIFNNRRIQQKNTTEEQLQGKKQQQRQPSKVTFVTTWEKAGFGMISPLNIEKLIGWIQYFGGQESVINKAIEIASENNPKAPYKYIEGILKSWQNKGIKNVADIEAEELKHSKKENAAKNDYDSEWAQVNASALDF